MLNNVQNLKMLRTDIPTDRASCRVACTRLKTMLPNTSVDHVGNQFKQPVDSFLVGLDRVLQLHQRPQIVGPILLVFVAAADVHHSRQLMILEVDKLVLQLYGKCIQHYLMLTILTRQITIRQTINGHFTTSNREATVTPFPI